MSAARSALSGDETGVQDPAAALAHVTTVVNASGSSFSLGMKILPKVRRQAMFAIYAFCREVDDVADEDGDPQDKLARLGEWRTEVDRLYADQPTLLTTMALQDPVHRFGLPKEEFIAIIDGMEMDARESMRAPDLDDLKLYCRRVAGAVGLLSIPVFGAGEPDARKFALALGEALQLTNVLRDIDEDALRGRLYLPRELLNRHGISPDEPPSVVAGHHAVAGVCADLAEMARERFSAADRYLAGCDRRALRPALLMMGIYDAILRRLQARGWTPGLGPIRMSKAAKIWAAFNLGLWRPQWQPST